MRVRICAAALIVSMGFHASAAPLRSPTEIVQKLYAPYLADPHAEEIDSPAALELIRPYASRQLKHAIHRNDVCERMEQGVCNIDFDIIINGQDWDLSHFMLLEDESKETALPVVHAQFLSMGEKQEVNYFFISEDGAWKIDEVEAQRFKKKGKVDAPFKLKEALSQ